MTDATLPFAQTSLWSALRTKAPAFSALALFLLLSMTVTWAAMHVDPRQFQGGSIWLKPMKFQVGMGIYALSLAFFAQWVPESTLRTRWFRGYSGVVVIAVLFEVVWVGAAAAFGTASHFNTTGVWGPLYALAGVFAITLASASLVMGVSIWRNRQTGLAPTVHLSMGTGLVLTFILTLIVAGYLSSTGGHHVGIPTTGARVPIFGWSREVGDLRIAHFLATHALHALPLIGWLASLTLAPAPALRAVWASAAGFAALTLGLFAQALMGLPLIP